MTECEKPGRDTLPARALAKQRPDRRTAVPALRRLGTGFDSRRGYLSNPKKYHGSCNSDILFRPGSISYGLRGGHSYRRRNSDLLEVLRDNIGRSYANIL